MTLDHSALWSMYASLEELRGKIGHVLKCAIQMSKVAWSNVIAKRCQKLAHPIYAASCLTIRPVLRSVTIPQVLRVSISVAQRTLYNDLGCKEAIA